jgi:LuxR family transcriptional regulator, maltose regulon positive regulatory protein
LIWKRHLTLPEPPLDQEGWPWPVEVCTLGRFEIVVNGKPVAFSKKAQRKPIALLKVLIASGAQRVREERLIDLLWPDAAGDAGTFSLTTTLHRLRRLLGNSDAVLRQDHEVTLNRRLCWVDALAAASLLERAENMHLDSVDSVPRLAALTSRLVRLYQGEFLSGEENDAPWVRPMGDRIKGRMLKHLWRMGQYEEQLGRWSEAADAYEIGMRVDACAEDVCRRLMSCYDRLGRRSEVERTYRRCRDNLTTRLGAVPSKETDDLLNQLRAGGFRPV